MTFECFWFKMHFHACLRFRFITLPLDENSPELRKNWITKLNFLFSTLCCFISMNEVHGLWNSLPVSTDSSNIFVLPSHSEFRLSMDIVHIRWDIVSRSSRCVIQTAWKWPEHDHLLIFIVQFPQWEANERFFIQFTDRISEMIMKTQ